MVEYFSNLGFPCPLYVNPADFIFDTLHDEGKGEGEEEEEEGGGGEEEDRVDRGVAEKFGGLFESSKQYELLQTFYGQVIYVYIDVCIGGLFLLTLN